MFEQLDLPKWRMSPRLARFALWAAVLGGFGLGFDVGRFASGAKPFDGWVLEGFNLAMIVAMIVWLAGAAMKSLAEGQNSAHP